MGNVDIRPDLAAEGGGLIDDFDGTIADSRFIMTDYEGKMADKVCVNAITFDVDGEESNQLYSVGGKGDFAPDDTGRGIDKLKSKAALTKSCKFMRLMDSLVEAGFPIPKMDARDVMSIIGTQGHFLRKVVEYEGLKKKKDDDREDTVLLCTKINKLPWEVSKAANKVKGKAGSKAVDEGLAETVAGIVQGVIIEADGSISKKDMLSTLFKSPEMEATGNKKAALKLAADDSYLKGRDEWEYEDGVLKMG